MFYRKRIERLLDRIESLELGADYERALRNKPELIIGKNCLWDSSNYNDCTPKNVDCGELLELKIVYNRHRKYYQWIAKCYKGFEVSSYEAYKVSQPTK